MRPLGEVLALSIQYLQRLDIPSPRLDAEILVGHALGVPRLQVYLQFERPLLDEELERIRLLLRRRAAREPVAWITGVKEFYGRAFRVGPGLLVPRPDSETLIDVMLPLLPPDEPLFLADIGCGTGCLGLTLAMERPALRLFATDLSVKALEYTRDNAIALGIKDRVALLHGDLLTPIPPDRDIDWLVCNPPYVATDVLDGLQPEVARHEPRLALDGGPDGLAIIRRLLPSAAARVRKGLVVEIGHDQGQAVTDLALRSGFSRFEVHQDLAGNDRVGVALKG